MPVGLGEYYLPDEAATAALAGQLARAILAAGATDLLILLSGDLGAGKTSFSRGLLRALGHTGPVPSPTYTLLEPYEFEALTVNHLDLYRLSDGSELEALGWRDLGGSIRLVEWPERAPDLAAAGDLSIALKMADPGREAEVRSLSSAGRSVLDGLANTD